MRHYKLEKLAILFPELQQSVVHQGIILSKLSYNYDEVNVDNIGQILGYLCDCDFEYIMTTPNKESFTMSLIAVLQSGENIHILNTRYKDMSNLNKMNDMAVCTIYLFK